MNVSIISRHEIYNQIQYINYLIHDVFIIFFFISLFYQFMNNQFKILHRKNGLFLVFFIIPILFVSGFWLSFKINDQNYAFLFRNYGYHLLMTSHEIYITGIYNTKKNTYIYIYMYFIYCNMYILKYLYNFISLNPKYIDFICILFPLPFINLLNIYYLIYSTPKYYHKYNAHVFVYLSLLGTFFSISQDNYWFFSKPLSFFQRFLIQKIPLSLFIYKLRSKQ